MTFNFEEFFVGGRFGIECWSNPDPNLYCLVVAT